MTETCVIIVGAGQQGLALSHELSQKGYPHIILEKEARIGEQWRKHYDSLRLFTPRRYSHLPGVSLSGNQNAFAEKDEFAEYLERYAKEWNAPVVLNAPVVRLKKDEEFFVVETPERSFRARAVIVATGYSVPYVPECADDLSSSVFSIHSSNYKNSQQIPEGEVLVVGAGNSAAQIACELSNTHSVTVALREPPHSIPPSVLGVSFYFWRELFHINDIPADSFIGHLIRSEKDFVVGYEFRNKLKDATLKKRSGVFQIQKDEMIFDDGSRELFRTVIWATGYVQDFSWVNIPEAFEKDGSLKHKRGVSAAPGLFFAGLRNQITTASSNIYGAGHTARFIVRQLKRTGVDCRRRAREMKI